VFETAEDFDRIIDQHRLALRVYLGYSAFVIGLGGILVLSSFVAPPDTSEAELLMRVGGTFVAAVSAFPLNQYLERRDRMNNVRALKAKWEKVNGDTGLLPEQLTEFQKTLITAYVKWVVG
jgi:hypothetical protein